MATTKSGIKYLNQSLFYGGVSPSLKIGGTGSFGSSQRLNIFTEPSQITIMPQSVKVSGSVVTDLIKWIVPGTPYDTNTYFYSSTGNIYKEDATGKWSLIHTVPNSHGQGLAVFQDYLYYASDFDIGRYGPLDNAVLGPLDNWGSMEAISDSQPALVSTAATGFAPILNFTNGIAIANGNNLAFWDGAVLTTQALVLPTGINIRSLEINDMYLVMGTMSGNDIRSNDTAYLFFWDGTIVPGQTGNVNNFVSIPQGGASALLNYQNQLFTASGSNGQILLNYQPFALFQVIPGLGLGTFAEIYPGAVTTWRGFAQVGIAANTDSPTIINGVYTIGSVAQQFPQVITHSFSTSSGGVTGTGLKIGALLGKGDYLYIGWQNENQFGVDKVTNTNAPYATGVFESLVFDGGELYKDKNALTIKATHLPLNAGETIQLGYKINRASSYTLGTVNNTAGSTETKINIQGGRFREFQMECILGTSVTTSPTVTFVGLEYDSLPDEDVY